MNEGPAGLSLRDWLPARLRQIATMVAFDLIGPLTLYAVLRSAGLNTIIGARIPR